MLYYIVLYYILLYYTYIYIYYFILYICMGRWEKKQNDHLNEFETLITHTSPKLILIVDWILSSSIHSSWGCKFSLLLLYWLDYGNQNPNLDHQRFLKLKGQVSIISICSFNWILQRTPQQGGSFQSRIDSFQGNCQFQLRRKPDTCRTPKWPSLIPTGIHQICHHHYSNYQIFTASHVIKNHDVINPMP